MKKITKEQLFQRQTTLAEFGWTGQQKLQNAKVVIIGCGGLGNSAAIHLAASGIGSIHLVDMDSIDVSNLHRQVFFTIQQIGKSKAETLAKYIYQISPFVEVSYSNEKVSKLNIFETINGYDLVLDCTDNLSTKYLINDACVLRGKILVYGSLYKFDGYVGSFNTLDDDGNRTANLRDAFPEIPKNSIPNCSEAGTLNTIVGIIGLLQANEVIKIITKIGNPLVNQLLIYNSLDNSQYKMKLKNTFTNTRIKSVFEKENYAEINYDSGSRWNQEEELLISSKELRRRIIEGKNPKIISVIENVETELPFNVDLKIPLSILDVHKIKFDKNEVHVVVCNKGISSYIAVQRIKEANPNIKVYSLKNGISRY